VAKAIGRLPQTVDEAVRLLRGMVPQSEQDRIAAMPEEELMTLDFGLGTWIRNNLGLWQENQVLLNATECHSADDASAVIIHGFWLALREERPKVH